MNIDLCCCFFGSEFIDEEPEDEETDWIRTSELLTQDQDQDLNQDQDQDINQDQGQDQDQT